MSADQQLVWELHETKELKALILEQNSKKPTQQADERGHFIQKPLDGRYYNNRIQESSVLYMDVTGKVGVLCRVSSSFEGKATFLRRLVDLDNDKFILHNEASVLLPKATLVG